MPAQHGWLAPQLLNSTISRDLGSQGGRRRITRLRPALQSAPYASETAQAHAGKSGAADTWDSWVRGCGPSFRIAGLGRPPGVLSAAISPTNFSPRTVGATLHRGPSRVLVSPASGWASFTKMAKFFARRSRERIRAGGVNVDAISSYSREGPVHSVFSVGTLVALSRNCKPWRLSSTGHLHAAFRHTLCLVERSWHKLKQSAGESSVFRCAYLL